MQIAASSLTLNSLRFAAEMERRDIRTGPTPAPGRDPVPATAQTAVAQPAAGSDGADAELLEAGRELALLVRLIEALTGREMKLPRIDLSLSLNVVPADVASAGRAAPGTSGPALDLRVEYREVEALAFSAGGQLETADGRRVTIDFDQLLVRSYQQVSTVSLRPAPAATRDPLILNFGSGPELTRGRVSFDLDGNGSPESIAFATGDSAFLALDRNGNGRIDDGLELFGARTGDGFEELAAFDEDGNGFIDSGDAVFERLRLLSRGEDGASRLVSLAEREVGALYLGRVATPFDVNTTDNETLARVRTSGLYLDEQLRPGSLQQLDLVV
jgi:hypothetical protein